MIQQSDAQIKTLIINALIPKLNRKFGKARAKIESDTATLLRKYITAQPEYDAILHSPLRYELGLTDASSKLSRIIDALILSVTSEFVPFTNSGNNLSGGIKLRAVRSDYRDILALPDSHVRTDKGEDLPWLEWLLTEGTNILIADFRVKFGDFGRTGGAIMVPRGSWGIPSEYSGQSGNNFITRAIEQLQDELKTKILSHLK